jgi:hypothetical protein
VLLNQEKNIQKKKQREKSNSPKKKLKKKEGKRGTTSAGAHGEGHSELCWHVMSCALFVALFDQHNCSLPCYHNSGTWNILDQQQEQQLGTIIQHCYRLLTFVPHIYLSLCLPKLHIFLQIGIERGPLQSWCHLLTSIMNQPPIAPTLVL